MLGAGTQIVREWNDRTYRVDVLDEGFRWDGTVPVNQRCPHVGNDEMVTGWGGRIRTCEWRHQKPLPYHLATPHQFPLTSESIKT